MPLYFLACTNQDNVRPVSNIITLIFLIFSLELNQLTGIAAILNFPLDVEVVEAEEREEAEALKRHEEEQALEHSN